MQKRWCIKKADNKIVKKLAEDLKTTEIIAHLLVLRGINSFEEAKSFFRPTLENLHDPFLMKDMQRAVDRLSSAIKNNEKILVYGDYDVDGTTSVAMMYNFLKKQSQNVGFYIPCRYEEGYGVSLKGIDYAKSNEFSLVIALDCGTRAIDQVDYANARAIDFIICDHHATSPQIPNAIAVLNPKQFDCNYPYKELSGCGVGFKLIQAYSSQNNIPFNKILEYLDLLAISIGADIVPMTGENRVLAFYGLKQINSNARMGIKALIEAASKNKELTMSDVIFGIAPRINAAGRIDHAKKAVEILVEQDYNKAKSLAVEIEKNNKTRKDLDQSITKEALAMIDENKKSTVVFSDKWHKGVVGIVASRVIESYYKPTIVFAEANGVLTGSARSVHDFDLYEAISNCSHLCEKFGGHKYAAGLSVKKENLQAFIDMFEEVVSEKITTEQLSPKIDADMEIDINYVNEKMLRIIKRFAPFGPLNTPPMFISQEVFDTGYGKKIGADKSHLRINAKTERGSIACIGFGMGHFFHKIKNQEKFKICYSITENEWGGRKTLQLVLADISS
tara:strand:+ start:986 stop:2668 length:1683 start_codon:yes stop_codon:yes gene_type:complete